MPEIKKGTPEYREFQAKRYTRRGVHAVACRHCGREVAETRLDAKTGICTNCIRQGKV